MKLTTIAYRFIISFWRILPKRKSAYLIKKIPLLKNKLYKDLRFNGIFNTNFRGHSIKLYNPGFTTIENEIFWNGVENGWEKVSLNIWGTIAKECDVILDIGANSGIYSLLAGAINHNAKIFAFEPVSRTALLLKKNRSINNFDNIVICEKAVSNKSGTATFYDLETESQYSASLNADMLSGFSNRINYEVEVVVLDEMPELKNLKIDLIKLDVEMHEPEALEGMINIIKRSRPTLLIEILTDEIGEKVEERLSGLEYLYFNIDEINSPRRVKNIRKSMHYNFLLCSREVAEKLHLNCSL